MRGENKWFLLSFFIRLVSIVKHSVTVRLVIRLSKVDLTGRLSVYFVLASTVNGNKNVLEGFTKPRLLSTSNTAGSRKGKQGIISIGKSCLRFHSVQNLDETALIELIQATETADIMT
jgi:hypothetical protein